MLSVKRKTEKMGEHSSKTISGFQKHIWVCGLMEKNAFIFKKLKKVVVYFLKRSQISQDSVNVSKMLVNSKEKT